MRWVSAELPVGVRRQRIPRRGVPVLPVLPRLARVGTRTGCMLAPFVLRVRVVRSAVLSPAAVRVTRVVPVRLVPLHRVVHRARRRGRFVHATLQPRHCRTPLIVVVLGLVVLELTVCAVFSVRSQIGSRAMGLVMLGLGQSLIGLWAEVRIKLRGCSGRLGIRL